MNNIYDEFKSLKHKYEIYDTKNIENMPVKNLLIFSQQLFDLLNIEYGDLIVHPPDSCGTKTTSNTLNNSTSYNTNKSGDEKTTIYFDDPNIKTV